jgi:AraC-like DNA-binding protein
MFVGDSVRGFKENDLVLLGPNVPHCWINDDQYYGDHREQNAEAIVVRFHELFLGKDQFALPEMKAVKRLFEKANRGLLITGDGKERILASIRKMVNYEGMERIIIFLGVLNAIINSCEHTELSSMDFMSNLRNGEEIRLNKVYHLMVHHFRDKITLAEIAHEAGMNPSAFSRYFSQCTGKSVTGFLQEIRLKYACRLLEEEETNILEVMHKAGFQNQAYFNKLFASKMKTTPKKYRKLHKIN